MQNFILHFPHLTRSFSQQKQKHCFVLKKKATIIVAVTEGLVREEQLLHDMCLLGAVTVEITQILTRARFLT